MDNLQNAVNKEVFNKKIFILYKSIISIDNINNEFNIHRVMTDKAFNYDDLNLTIVLHIHFNVN